MSRRTALTPEQREEYLIEDLPYQLEKEAKKRDKSQKDMAKALGISYQALHARKQKQSNGKPKDAFSYGDLLKIFRLLDMSKDEILKLFPQ